jgi:hypothetical protein
MTVFVSVLNQGGVRATDRTQQSHNARMRNPVQPQSQVFCYPSSALAGSEETLGVEHEYYYRSCRGLHCTARYFASGYIFAGDPVTEDEAVSMVKKAVAAIKAEGPDKAYA